jgi:anti-anti-sigma regulatory factor
MNEHKECLVELLPNRCTIITLSRMIDDDPKAFIHQIEHLVKDGGITFIFDCSHLSDISSTGIARLVYVLERSREHNDMTVLSGARDNVIRRFDRLGFSAAGTLYA